MGQPNQPEPQGEPQGKPDVGDPLDNPTPEPREPEPQPEPDDDNDPAKLKANLAIERTERRKLVAKVAELQRSQLDENQKAIADAREEGKREALRESAVKVAAASLRAAAAGKISAAVVAEISAERFVTDEGEVDEDAIKTLVEKLEKAAPAAPNGKVPAGPRSTEPDTKDWLRSAMSQSRR